ncbi:MAG: carbohydrate ABC transporter substrate-binding protein [Thermoleophilia bacterium]|nr:carbohydrate ABC transporter substrate-binding protein [Thermoleophilia bacterium]
MAARMTRREFVGRAAAVGLGALAAPVLSACAGGSQGGSVDLRAWSQVTPRIDRWRMRALRAAVADVEDFEVELTARNFAEDWPEYLNRFTLAASARNAPHVVVAGHELSAPWSAAGWIEPFDDCRERYDEFDAFVPGLWDAVEFEGRVWGAPFEPEARPMFFHKRKLRELGWSQAQVDELPDRLDAGTFTLDDLVHTSRQAIDRGVVRKGFAYWHRPQPGFDFLQYYVAYGGTLHDAQRGKLVVRRDPLRDFFAFQRRVVEEELTPRNFIPTEWETWHSTVAGGETLFWNGGIWMWAEWLAGYIGDRAEAHLFDFVGYGVQPTGVRGERGRTLSRPLAYFVTSSQASGASPEQVDAACALVAKSMTPDTRTPEVLESAHLGWLESQDLSRDRFLESVSYMIQDGRAFFIPNDVNFGQYNTIIYDHMLRAEQGEMTPAQAADAVVARMKLELRDAVVFE